MGARGGGGVGLGWGGMGWWQEEFAGEVPREAQA